MTTEATAVIVDGYSAGNFLPTAFRRLGVASVHVLSTPRPIAGLAPPRLDRYQDAVVCADADAVDGTVRALAAYRPLAALAGAESGVPLADALSERLGLATNGSGLSAARRDKYLMTEALRRAGIRCARQLASADPGELAAWAAGSERGRPVVVKPISSSAADGVYICRDPGEVERAARAVLAARDRFRRPNAAVLAQSYLDGTEYVVDVVTAYGHRYVSGVWRYEKLEIGGGRRVYRRNVLLDPGRSPVQDLTAYVDDVLAALGIRHGPAHAEVIMTPDGPTLVEIAARLNGGMDAGFQDRCLGANQADLTALAYARPGEFRRRYGGRSYERRLDAVVYHGRTRMDGTVAAVDRSVVDRIAALPTVHHVEAKLAPGDRIRPTVDLATSPLRVYQACADPARLAADGVTIEDLEDLVYDVRPAGTPR
ncbi:MAG TPA: ATP-grasp domain-containing protein [Streptosporangiaceae bacterium]